MIQYKIEVGANAYETTGRAQVKLFDTLSVVPNALFNILIELNLSSSNKTGNSTDSADHSAKTETVRTKQQPSKYRYKSYPIIEKKQS